jgi:hypothetical protein
MRSVQLNRRRLAIVVAFLMGVGALIAWKFSWRGDDRFIGRWRIVNRSTGRWTSSAMEFHPGGLVENYHLNVSRRTSAYTSSWWMEDDQLILRTDRRERGWELLKAILRDAVESLRSSTTNRTVRRYAVSEAGANQLQLEELASGYKILIENESARRTKPH